MDVLWDVRVSLDLFLGGLGIGALLVGALLYYLDARAYAGFIKKAFLIAPAAIIAGLLLLLTELGRPLNVIKTLYAVNPTSFMSIGIFVQGACVLVALFLAWRVLSREPEELSGTLVYFSAVLAGVVGLYHGFLLTGISIEPWNNAIPVIFFVSSILAGAGLVLLTNPGGFGGVLKRFKLPVVLNLLLTLELAVLAAWIYNLALTTQTSKQAYDVLMGSFALEFWGLSVLVGLVLPLALFTLVLMKKMAFKSVIVPAAVAMIAGSFFLKNMVVYLGQAV
jgi:protein NrfD